MKAALIIATLVWVNSAHADIVLDPNAIVQMLYAQQKWNALSRKFATLPK